MQAVKFTFDKTFDDDYLEAQKVAEEAVLAEEEIPPPPTFSEDEMAVCREAAFAEGRTAGRTETEQGIGRIASDALQVIGSEIGNLAAIQKASVDVMHRDAISLAAAIVRKTIPAIARETAGPAIENFIRDSLPRIIEEPRIVVRIADSLLDQLKEDLQQIATQSGFAGQMIVMADAEMSIQDCRVEWADGGAERDSGRIWREIDESIERFLESLTPAEPVDPVDPAPPEITEDVKITEIPTPDRVS